MCVVCGVLVECWIESTSTITSSKLGVDFKTHCNKGPFVVAAKSARKRARSLALRGGETAVLMASDLL